MELRLHHIIDHLYNVYLENKDSDNCDGTKMLDDGHDCNIASMNSLNIHDVNDDCIGRDNDVSYKDVNFCE